MKKEYWLYVVVAILAIWVVVSYVKTDSESDTADKSDTETASTTGKTSYSGGANENALLGMEAGPNKGTYASKEIPTSGNIIVKDQMAGSMIKIESVDIPVSGWIVIHEMDKDGKTIRILGAQRFDPGSYAGGQVELLRSTVSGSKYIAIIHEDDGDKIFDKTMDHMHVKNSVGSDASAIFSVI